VISRVRGAALIYTLAVVVDDHPLPLRSATAVLVGIIFAALLGADGGTGAGPGVHGEYRRGG